MSERICIGSLDDFPSDEAKVVTVNGISLNITRAKDEFCAVANKCPHLGLPLGTNKIEGTRIECPFHGSQFDMCSGENLDWVRGVGGVKLPEWSRRLIAMGKKPSPLKTFPVIIENDQVYIEI